MKKKIIYIVSEDWYFLSHRLALARESLNKGYDVYVLCKDTGVMNNIKNYGFKCYNLQSVRSKITIKSFIKEVININSIVKTINPSIIHLIAFRPILLGLCSLFFNKKIEIIISITGLGSIFLSKSLKVKFFKLIICCFLFINFRKKNLNIIVQNKDDYKFCNKTLNCDQSRIFLVRGSGVDVNYFSYSKEPKSPPIILTFVGRVIKDKGIETLFKAFNIANKNIKDIKLLIAGSIDHLNPSAIDEKYIKDELNNNKNITWLGEVSNIKALWAKSHIAVLPSRREGLPKSLLEAAASGKPILATDVPGCREIAINNLNSITVPLDNEVKLAEGIEYLVKNYEVRKKFGIESRKLVEKDLSEKSIINKTVLIYQNILRKIKDKN